MQRIHGKYISSLQGRALRKALQQYKAELKKILELGIDPVDCTKAGNALFDPKKERLYLIDFEFWKEERTLDSGLDEEHLFLGFMKNIY
ncbi:MAG: hypothetical protein HY514_02090 [Candidatus Aenigmarchaeota archaeon]|nr:hypothetical protein [Candidatus Aenigmarchaeota archaeon]